MSELKSESELESGANQVRFDPPVYMQRYDAAVDILDVEQIHKVVDFGCNNMAFLNYLRKINKLTSILAVDYDNEILLNFHHRAEPIIHDTICPRKQPLNISVLHGSVCDPDYRLIGCDAVVAIELIEHLDSGVLDRLPQNIFGFIKPLVVIITTPNADFNVLFGAMKCGEFRHPDHRFEWSREQFQDWCNNIVLRYPDYEVEFQGIGKGPAGTEHLGCCSQLASFKNLHYNKESDVVFNQMDEKNTCMENVKNSSESIDLHKIGTDCSKLNLRVNSDDLVSYDKEYEELKKNEPKSYLWDGINWPESIQPQQYYKVVATYDYPFFVDSRTELQKILDQTSYVIRIFSIDKNNTFYDCELNIWKLPIDCIIQFYKDFDIDIDALSNILSTNEYKIENGCLLYKDIDSDDSDDLSNSECTNNAVNEDMDANEEEWTVDDSEPWG